VGESIRSGGWRCARDAQRRFAPATLQPACIAANLSRSASAPAALQQSTVKPCAVYRQRLRALVDMI
jgi:hypothetical protein